MALVGQQLLEAANTAVQDACKRPVKLSQIIFFTLNAQLFTAMMMVQILILLLMLDARHLLLVAGWQGQREHQSRHTLRLSPEIRTDRFPQRGAIPGRRKSGRAHREEAA